MTRLYFLGCLAVFGGLVAVAWPGYLMSDSVSSFKFGLEYPVEQWLGFFTPFLYSNAIQIVPHIGVVSLLQGLLASAVFAYCGETLDDLCGRRGAALVFYATFLVFPSAIFNLLLLSRDTPFSLLILWETAFLLRFARQRTFDTSAYMVAGVIAACICTLRGDGWIFAAGLAIALAILRTPRRQWLAFLGAMFVSAAVYSVVLPRALGSDTSAFSYKVVNTINPLGYVLQSPHKRDYHDSLSTISRVVDVEKIAREQTPYEIPSWWNGGVLMPGAGETDRSRYLRAVGRYLADNAGIYTAGRVETFFAASGMNENGFRYADVYAIGWPLKWVPPARLHLNLQAGRPFPRAFAAMDRWIRDSAIYSGMRPTGSAIHWNLIPWMSLCALCVLAYGWSVPVALAGAALIIRVPAILLLAPASQFKYYLSVQYGGMFLATAVLCLAYRHVRERAR